MTTEPIEPTQMPEPPTGNPEFTKTHEPRGSAGQRSQEVGGYLGILGRRLNVELVGPEDFATPFNVTTGETGEGKPTGGRTGINPGPAIDRDFSYGGYRRSRAELEKKFPQLRGRVGNG